MNTFTGTQTAQDARRFPNVVVVDDDDIDIMALRRALAKQAPAPATWVAHDGRQALELLGHGLDDEASPRAPCVVLLDINMPRMDGFEFLEHVRSDPTLHDLVVFVMSTSDAREDVRRAYSYNVAGYIHKARDGRSLDDVVAMIDRYCTTVELPDTP